MFLSNKYRANSFNQQYYKISRAPFVKMDIEPNSSLAEVIIAVAWGKDNSFEGLDLLLIEHNSYGDEPFIDLKLSKDHPIYKEAEENLEELNTLQDEYERFLREIINSDLMLVHCVDHRFIPTDKLLGIDSAPRRPDATDTNITDYKLESNQQYNLRTIGALTLLLIEKTNGERFGSREKPNKAAIYTAIQDLLCHMGLSEDGQAKTRMNDVLKDALNVAFTKKSS